MTDSVAAADSSALLLDVRGLRIEFDLGRHRQPLRAVDDVDLTVAPGETVGLVGESGSGKTTIGKAVLGLTPVSAGTIVFDGADITHAGYRQRRTLSTHLQVVFQDPYSSLNPTRTVGQTLAEMLRVQGHMPADQTTDRVHRMLEKVGLDAEAAKRYPAQFSGGQRQRIAIARALMANPRLVICDEPVSALDLSVQAQVLNLLHELQDDLGLSYLFIAHDLAVVHHLSHRIVVLYRGRVMEQGPPDAVYHYPGHPYTRALLDAIPLQDPKEQAARRRHRQQQPRSESAPLQGSGCPFAPRCPHVVDICESERPALEQTPAGALVACHRWRELRDDAAVGSPARAPSEMAGSSAAL